MKLIKTIANCCLVFITVIAVCVIIAFVYYHYFVKDTTIGVNNINDQLAVDIKKDDELTDEEKDKSGVGGGIMAVVPTRMGIGIFGPALDRKGNSVAGIRLLERLSQELYLSIF